MRHWIPQTKEIGSKPREKWLEIARFLVVCLILEKENKSGGIVSKRSLPQKKGFE